MQTLSNRRHNMEKLLLGVLGFCLLTGCGTQIATSPTKEVETMLGKYQKNDEKILEQLDASIANENMTKTQREDYRALMMKQYNNLTYDIKDEIVDGNNAIVTTEIEVYDFGETIKEVNAYVDSNPNDFQDPSGALSTQLYTGYKLTKLSEVTDRIKYTININLTKRNDTWVVDQLTETDLQKIHGIYIS